VFDEVDEARFSLALKEAFPAARIVSSARSREPRLCEFGSLTESGGFAVLVMVPEPFWAPEWSHYAEYDLYHLVNPAKRSFSYSRSNWYWGPRDMAHRWSWTPPTLERGEVEFEYRRDDLEMKRFMRQVLKLVEQLSTNRLSGGDPEGQMTFAKAGGGLFWAGHHALTWCQENDRRMLLGCRRPCTDWRRPETPWHRRLDASLEEWRQQFPAGRIPPFRNAPDED
jgi:hypothetical protein